MFITNGLIRSENDLQDRLLFNKCRTEKHSGLEHLHFGGDFDKLLGKFSFVTGGPDDVIVDPVVVAAPRLVEQQKVVFESPFFQPGLRNGFVLVRPGSEKRDDMSLFIPLVDHLDGIRIR